MTAYRATMLVGGEQVAGEREDFDVLNPATEEVWNTAPSCSPAQLDQAFAAAAAAVPAWARDEDRRREALAGIAVVMRENTDELALLLTLEQGKKVSDSRGEIGAAIAWFEHFATLEVSEPQSALNAGRMITALRRPLGVVAAITPWNFPVCLAAWKLAPALRAGNTVVLKPSPYTPIATLRFAELIAEVLPPGVVNAVTGGDDLGAQMTAHRVPRKVSFTGSIETGKAVARSVAGDLKRITLELGGNDPAIVLDDVDVAAVAPKIFWGAFYNNGQVCGAIKQVYVASAQHEALAEALSAIADGVTVGDGTHEDTVLGPINNSPQFERVKGLVDDAVSQGATVRSGGTVVGDRGYFLRPTILTDLAPGSAVVTEEQFGPVLPLIAYDDVDAAVAQANDSVYGLSSSVWSNDTERAFEVGRGLQHGTTWINNHGATAPSIPFGGAELSGIGVEGGLDGLHEFTQLHIMQAPVA